MMDYKDAIARSRTYTGAPQEPNAVETLPDMNGPDDPIPPDATRFSIPYMVEQTPEQCRDDKESDADHLG